MRERARLLERRNVRLETEQETAAARASAEERIRIARELHDVVAHALSLIVVQARGGRRMVHRSRPAETLEAFDTVELAAQRALDEMRRLLGMLREDEDDLALTPPPSLARLPELIDQVADAGLRADLVIEGEPRDLPPGIDVSAYRIVQEALTNALRHSGASRARVVVTYGPTGSSSRCSTRARERKTPRAPATALIGIRERVAIYGGELQAGQPARGRLRAEGPPAALGDRVIRVLIADDERLVRAGFRRILDDEDDIRVVAEAADGEEAVTRAAEARPDVVLMDMRMPVVNGIEATRRIVVDENAPRVLVLTTFDLDEYVYSALQAGASGFLLKDAPEEQLLAAIRVVSAGGALFSPTVTRRLIDEFARRHEVNARTVSIEALTPRENEVLLLVAQGMSNAEIAAELVVSEHTAKTHVARILAKLGLRDRAQAVVAAYESGLVRPGS